MNNDLIAVNALSIWNNSYLLDVQEFEFSDAEIRDRIAASLSYFKALRVDLDWYDSGFFKIKPVYTLKVSRHDYPNRT